MKQKAGLSVISVIIIIIIIVHHETQKVTTFLLCKIFSTQYCSWGGVTYRTALLAHPSCPSAAIKNFITMICKITNISANSLRRLHFIYVCFARLVLYLLCMC